MTIHTAYEGPTPTLRTERLVLRQPAPRDCDAVCAFLTSERSATLGGPNDAGRAWRIFAQEIGHWAIRGYGMWAVTTPDDDTAIGMIGPWCPDDWPETEIGWMMFGNAEGKGLAFEAARAAIDDAYSRLGWRTAVSYIAPENARSIALAERLGAVLDPDAPQPKPDQPCLVYRHPVPEVAR